MNDSDTRTRDSAPAENRIGITATGLAVAGLVGTYLLPGLLFADHSADVGGFAVATGVTVVLAAALFGWAVPRAMGAPGATNRPATAALVTSVFAVVSLALHWLGAPLVVAGAGIALALRGRERAERSGRRGLATAALAISAFVVVAALAIVVNDLLGHVGLGLQPPE